MSKGIFLLLAGMLCVSFLWAQTRYNHTDLALIKKNRLAHIRAADQIDRKKLYRLGLFFESIYNKYRDTSMRAAIRCYTDACYTESDFFEKESYWAARRLGFIYETGKTVPINLYRALVYYYLADRDHRAQYNTFGACDDKDYLRVSALYRKRLGFDHLPSGKPQADSIVFRVMPFFGYDWGKVQDAIYQMGAYLQKNPGCRLRVSVSGDNSFPAASYSLKTRAIFFPDLFTLVRLAFMDKGLEEANVLPLEEDYGAGRQDFRVVIRLEQ